MRIQKIYLDAFGPFSENFIDLSHGKEGLHIIYGPNEAGKSSALRAIIQLFFGIPVRSGDDFVHPYSSLRIGATVTDGKQSLDFVRIKKSKGALRDRKSDEILDESTLDIFLGGMDENTFTKLFGMNHTGLVDGGASIIEGHGNVGEALFSASAGLGNMRDVIENLQDEAGALFKSGGSKPRINAAISELGKLHKEIKSVQLRPNVWSDKDKELHNTIDNRNEIAVKKMELQCERNRIDRIIKALPFVKKHMETREKLGSVSDAVLLPEDFGEHFKLLLQEKIQVSSKVKNACDEMANIKENMKYIIVNDAVLEQEAEIEGLNALYATNSKALNDCHRKIEPELDLRETKAQKELELFRPGMKLHEVKSLQIKPAVRRRIQELGQQSASLKIRQENAMDALDKLRIAREGAAASLEKIESVPEPDELDRILRRIHKSVDIEERLREKRKEAGLCEKEIYAGISRLGLWNGSMDELEKLSIPSKETIDTFRAEFERLENQRKTLQERQRETNTKLKNIEEQISALKREHDTPTEQLLHEYRDVKNECWRLVRRDWEKGTPPGKIDSDDVRGSLGKLDVKEETMENLADAYESVNGETDRISDRLRLEADRVATLAQMEVNMISLREEAESMGAEYAGNESELKKCADSWDKLWNPLGIQPRFPKEMEAWAQHQREIVKKIGDYREAAAEIERISADIDRYRKELGNALASLGESREQDGESLSALLDRAEDTVSSLNKVISERTQLEKKLESIDTVEIPEAENSLNRANELLAGWVNEWAKAMAGLGENKDISPGEANEIIQQIDELTSLHDKIDELNNRIAQIMKDDGDFRQKVTDLAKIVDIDIDKMTEEQASQKLYTELKQNRENKSRIEALRRQDDAAKQRMANAKAELARIEEILEGLCREAHVSCTDDLQPAWEISVKRRTYENDIESIKERLTDLSSGQTLNEFIEVVKKEDIDALEPELSQIEEHIQKREEDIETELVKIGRLETELSQMDGSAEAACLEEDAQSLLAEISIDAEKYAGLKICEAVLARAVEQYRTKNQGPLLNHAGEIFSRLTMGSFQGLKTDFGEKDEDVLVGVRSDGKEPVNVSGMSDGTADQLYLALRLASLEQYFNNHQAIPLILDDVLVNFDNDRAIATLSILAELSRRTQIIYFTHHKHIVDMARHSIDENTLFTCEIQ